MRLYVPQKHEIYGFFYSFLKGFAEKYIKKYIPKEMKNGLSLRQ